MCCIATCERKVWARGFCASHYSQARASGDLESAPRIRRARGTGGKTTDGYMARAERNERKGEHVWIAESALGKPLTKGVEVHHFNEDKSDNSPGNLVVCPDHAYHALLHLRSDALKASGNADYRRCTFCKEWDAPKNLTFASSGTRNKSPKIYHASCRSAHRRAEKQQASVAH